MKRYCLTLNLKNDPELIKQYEKYHQKVWPEIIKSIKDAGIINMEIYRFQTSLFMIMDVDDSFSFERKSQMDGGIVKVEEWEALMWKYQAPMPGSAPGEKWMLMNKIFNLSDF